MTGRSRLYIACNTLLFVLLALAVFSVRTTYAQTHSAKLFLTSGKTQIHEGERVTVAVKINAVQEPINAISGIITFPPDLIRVVSINKEGSIIKLWTEEPRASSNRIVFEGVILNPGFQGSNGTVFSITFESRKTGTASLAFSEGSILANDGLGTNVLSSLGSTKLSIVPGENFFTDKPIAEARPPATLPVITKYFPVVGPKEVLYIRGKGEAGAVTKIAFEDVSVKSLGERLLRFLKIRQEKEPGAVVVQNDKNGIFHYISGNNLAAGTYNATPFLVDTEKKAELPGPSVQLLVNDSKIVKIMVIVLNVLGLLVPIVLILVVIYFIPWYSWRRMRVIKDKMLLEEEKIELTAEELKHKTPPLEK